MSIQTTKDIMPQFISIRPVNLYKQWNLTDLDFTTKSNLQDFISFSAAKDGWTGNLNNYYATYTGSIPNFPGINIKYARLYPNETGSVTEPNDIVVDSDGYVLSYNYQLGNGDKFYPLYQSQSGWMNPDGTYARLVHYSLQKLFYSGNSVYMNTFNGSGSYLSNEAIVIEIPQRYIADTIEPKSFKFSDSSNVQKLPYCSSSVSWSLAPYDNTISGNPLASEGIQLFDDGNGNLFDANYSASQQRGNIFYKLGIAVVTDIAYARYFREYLIISGNIL